MMRTSGIIGAGRDDVVPACCKDTQGTRGDCASVRGKSGEHWGLRGREREGERGRGREAERRVRDLLAAERCTLKSTRERATMTLKSTSVRVTRRPTRRALGCHRLSGQHGGSGAGALTRARCSRSACRASKPRCSRRTAHSPGSRRICAGPAATAKSTACGGQLQRAHVT